MVVANTGSAQFLEGDPITMTADDVVTTCVHMETINHCLLMRAHLAFQLEAARVSNQVTIPNDGEWVDLRS